MSKEHEDPNTLRAVAKAAAKRFRAGWVEMAALLVRIRREESYKQWEYDTFEAYCSQDLFIKPATAHKLTRGYAFLEKHESDLMKKPVADIEPPPFQVIEVLAKAEDQNLFSDHDYARLHDRIWQSKGTDQDRAREILDELPAPPPPPPVPTATALRRYASTARKLVAELKPSRQVPPALKEKLAAIAEELEALAESHSEARA